MCTFILCGFRLWRWCDTWIHSSCWTTPIFSCKKTTKGWVTYSDTWCAFNDYKINCYWVSRCIRKVKHLKTSILILYIAVKKPSRIASIETPVDQVRSMKKKGITTYLAYARLAFILPGRSMDAMLVKPGKELQCSPMMKPENGELCVCKQL